LHKSLKSKSEGDPVIPRSSVPDLSVHFGPVQLHEPRHKTEALNLINNVLSTSHKRTNVEFNIIEVKFDDELRSKTMTPQIKEALCKISITPCAVQFS
jgi:hypothetical protein